MGYENFYRGPLVPSGWRLYQIVSGQSRSIRSTDAILFDMARIGVGTFIVMAAQVTLWG